MGLERPTYKHWRMVCDKCGALGPPVSNKDEAIRRALDEGFTLRPRWQNKVYVGDWLCPDCRRG